MKTMFLGMGMFLIGATSYADASLLSIGRNAASAFFRELKVDERCTGFVPRHCKKEAEGKLSCVKNESSPGPARYWCKFADGLLDVEGESAQNAFENFRVEGSLDGMGNTTKEAYGILTCTYEHRWDAPTLFGCQLLRP